MVNGHMNKHKRHKKNRNSTPSAGRNKNESGTWVFGPHACLAVLNNPKRNISRILFTKNAADEFDHLIEQFQNPPEIVDRSLIDAVLPPDCVHQGVAVLAAPLPYTDVLDVAASLEEATPAVFLALDQANDPRNIGAILRTAAAFGCCGVIMPDRGSPEESGTMAKAAAGALEIVSLLRVTNLVRTMEELNEHGFWSIGLDGSADQSLTDIDLTGRVVLVLGAEGSGLRRLTRETCDHLAKIPISEDMESLNLSNAAAISLYEIARQKMNH